MVNTLILLTIAETLSKYGYYGLFGGSFLSSLFLPMGSDIMFVGMLAAHADPWICLLTASTGNWLGGLVIYGIGYSGNKNRIRKILRIKPEKIEKYKTKVDKYGSWLALIVWIPIIGDISNVALGFYRTHPLKTFMLMYVGRSCRFLLWVILYFLYSNRFVGFIDSV